MSAPVLLETSDNVSVVTLNRPDNRNSMTPELLDGFSDVVRTIVKAPPRAVVITGKGRCFCAGADFNACLQRGDDSMSPADRSHAMYEPFLSLLDVPVPVIGALNGHAVGGGFGLALQCDLRYGARQAKYGANFARLGLAPGMAISERLPHAIGAQRAKEMLFTGRLLDGDEAARWGLLAEAMPSEEVLPRAMVVAKSIAENAPLAIQAIRSLLLDEDAIRARARKEAALQAETLETEDAREGMQALLEKRTPKFVGR